MLHRVARTIRTRFERNDFCPFHVKSLANTKVFATFCALTEQKSFLLKSPKDPSLVITIPIVAWSLITLLVPISAASTKGIASLYQGVLTSLGLPSLST